MYYSWIGAPKTNPPDAPALFKMNVGDIIHNHLAELIEKNLQNSGPIPDEIGSTGHEIPFRWEYPGLVYPFSGRMDGRYCLEGLPSGIPSYIGVEYKSIFGQGVTFVKSMGPKEDALLQCAIYLKQDVLPIEEVEVMYVCRDSGYFIGYSVRLGDDPDQCLTFENMSTGRITVTNICFDGIVKALGEFEGYLHGSVPPPKDYGSQNPDPDNKWRCKYCSWEDTCGKDE
jgi:hypothetical protein